ncbi:MAG: DNA mismatch repair endonuclease MutL [Opitutaceae bacterium]|jgi:DNA mismatch repair protein MutL
MSSIRILSDRVANQIAAGEVIERPAAVVKELVENALDAGATRVEVEFRAGGRALISVEDNGHGMIRDDALLSLERHATSKISEAADLDRLETYGFRGEALPSVASVSRFTLQTRRADEPSGTEILVNGGKIVHVRECGRPPGTRIDVAQLFNSVPARRKFLKSDVTESAHIIQCVRLYALARPRVSFTLTEDGRVIFRSPECATLAERVAEIFGRQIAGTLLPLSAAGEGMRLEGLIGRPGIGRATRHEMITFVNTRPVDSRALNYALIESYHESLPKGRYPLAFVFFECDPAAVDVNVHPAKREVRFRNETAVRGFIIRGVLQHLRDLGEASAPAPAADRRSPGPEAAPAVADIEPAAGPPSPTAALALPRRETLLAASVATPPIRARPVPPAESPRPRTEGRPWRFLGLAHGAYVLFETDAGLVLLDRRAAYERVWFERLQAQFSAGSVASQRLLLPVPVELDPIVTALLLDRLEFLQRHGLEIAGFGRNFFRIEAVPDWLEPADAEPFLRDLLGAFREGRLQEKNPNLARDEFARLAVARALRLPAAAHETESLALVAQLFATPTPLTSPAGRPTYVELNHGELARRFQK